MCVIMKAMTCRPTDEMIKRAWDHNRDGGGAAWREKRADGVMEVVWKKGFKNVDDMLQLLHEIPLPFVAHFRVATVGGPKPTLTHPFLIDIKTASTDLEGRTTEAVLFHNGHWGEWNDKAMQAAIGSNNKIPTGDWSDTRALAWMVSIYGSGFMDLMTQQKAIIWQPDDSLTYTGKDGWEDINGVWCSNNNFWANRPRGNYAYSRKTCSRAGCSETVFDNGNVCWKCVNREKTTIPAEEETEGRSSNGNTTSSVQAESGRHQTAAPALAALTTGGRVSPLVKFLTLKEAEELNSRGGMSKSKLKDFRKWYKKLDGASGNQKERAEKKLLYISNQVAKDLLHGSVR